MNPACSRFLDRIDAFLAGALPAEAADEVSRHAASCRDCAAVLAALAEAAVVADAPAPDDLLPGVLARTTGPACPRAEILLAEAGLEDAVLEAHVAACPDCSALAGALGALARDLPALADPFDAPDLLPAILARTTTASATVPAGLRSWFARWEALVRRPRFALEASYAVVVVAILVVGVPDARPASTEIPIATVPATVEMTVDTGAESAGRAARWLAARVARAGREISRGLSHALARESVDVSTPAAGDSAAAAAGEPDEQP